MSDSVRKQGIVKWFNDKLGYGFIITDEGELFFHWRDIVMKGHKVLEVGDKVVYSVATEESGKTRAINITKE